jgi:hypothetical protein
MLRTLLLLPLLLAGCYGPGYRGLWEPKPAEAMVATGDGAPVARLSVAVLGTWEGEPWDEDVHLRFRVENSGDAPLRLPLSRLEVFSGDLLPFGPAYLVSGEDRELLPGETMLLDAGFARPPGEPDLRGLQVRWWLLALGQELPGSLSFRYVETYSPSYYGSVGVGYGYWPHEHWCDSGWGGGVVSAPVHVMEPHVGSAPKP